MRVFKLSAVLCTALALSACVDGARLFDADPGIYDGKADPLTEEAASDRAQALEERFKLVQERQ